MRSVGIHVDSRKIRILELDISPKRLSLMNIFEMDKGSTESLSEIIRSYFAAAKAKPDRVVASVGNVPVVIKDFFLPFKDRTRVQQAILSEFEDSLPIEIENFVLEFQHIGKQDSLQKFTAGLISREPLEDMNRVFDDIDIVPSDFLIPSEAIAKMGLSLLASEFMPGTQVCFCDIGFDSTQVSVVRFPAETSKKFNSTSYNHSLIEFRHIPRGSKDIYDREGDKLALSAKEFEEWLSKRVSFAGSGARLDDIKNAIRPLLVEIYQVSQAASSKSGQKVENFVLTGPLSHCESFRDFFETELRTPSLLWDPFQSVDTNRNTLSAESSARFTIPLALSLRHGAFKGLPWLNFRRSSKKRQIISAALEAIAQPSFRTSILPVALAGLAVFLLSIAASFMMDTRLSRQAERTQKAFSRAKVPLGSKLDRLLSEPDVIEEEFEAYKTKQWAQLPSDEKSSALIDNLLKISQSLPATAKAKEIKIATTGSVKNIEASLLIPNANKEEIQNTLRTKGFTDVSLEGEGSNLQLRMKGQ